MSPLKREAKEQRPNQTSTNNSTNLTFNPDRQTVAIESQKIILPGQESNGGRQAIDHLYGLNPDIIQGMQKERSRQRPDNQTQLQRDFDAAAAKLNRSEFNSILETMVSKVSSQGGNELGPLLERVRQDVMRSYDRVIESRESTKYDPLKWTTMEDAASQLGMTRRAVNRIIEKGHLLTSTVTMPIEVQYEINVDKTLVSLDDLVKYKLNPPKEGRPPKSKQEGSTDNK